MNVDVRRMVIVGVDGSPTSLQALRRAVAEARRAGAVLKVTHAYTVPAAALAAPVADTRDAMEEAAYQIIDICLNEALGGVPEDVPVCRTVVENTPPARALLDRVRSDRDLIVVGGSSPRASRWLPRWRRNVGAQCVRQATCPVLVVPPNQLQRELCARARRSRRDLDRQLADLCGGSDLSNSH